MSQEEFLDSIIDAERFPKLAELFDLARPYLEKNDFGVGHTKRVMKIARKNFQVPREIEELLFATIILHDVGGSSIGDQYKKGPEIAANLLKTLGYNEKFIREVCEMIRIHHNKPDSPSEAFTILYDSDQLAKLSQEEFEHYNSQKDINWNNIIEKLYHEHSTKLAIKIWKKRLMENCQKLN